MPLCDPTKADERAPYSKSIASGKRRAVAEAGDDA